MWSFLTGFCGILFYILKETLPLIVAFLKERRADKLAEAIKLANQLQEQTAQTARLEREKNGNELSKMEHFKLATLEQLFKQRRVRRKNLPHSSK